MRALHLRLISLVGLLALACGVGILCGSVPDAGWDIILRLRLPRVVTAVCTGAALGLSGAVIQAILANPLADPYTLGVSSGAALGAVLAGVLGLGWYWSPLAACAGAVGVILLITLFVRKGFRSAVMLLLIGVMIGFVASGAISLLMVVARPDSMYSILGWLMGDLSRAGWPELTWLSPLIALGAVWLLIEARTLDCLATGDVLALGVGVDVQAARRRLFLGASLLVAASVTLAGVVGFVGLVIPHFGRWLFSSRHRVLLPVSALGGAFFVVTADVLSRVLVRDQELPVGIFTSFIGVPVFIWILIRQAKSGRTHGAD